jgi:hypothetical protein
LRQNLDRNQNLDKQVNSNVNKEFLPKKSPNNPPKKSSQKNPPKMFLQKNSAKKIPPKNPSEKVLKKFQKNSKKKKFQKKSKNFKTISQKIPKILKISNSLHCTWRPKTHSGLFLEVFESL